MDHLGSIGNTMDSRSSTTASKVYMESRQSSNDSKGRFVQFMKMLQFSHAQRNQKLVDSSTQTQPEDEQTMQTQYEVSNMVIFDDESAPCTLNVNLKEPFSMSGDINEGLLTKQKKEGYIGKFEDLPEEWKDNVYLRTGYRIGFEGWSQVIKTLFMWHNETINVWTHFLGAIAFLTLTILIISLLPNMKCEAMTVYSQFSKSGQLQNLTMQGLIDQ